MQVFEAYDMSLADRTYVTVNLMVRMSSDFRSSVYPSVTNIL